MYLINHGWSPDETFMRSRMFLHLFGSWVSCKNTSRRVVSWIWALPCCNFSNEASNSSATFGDFAVSICPSPLVLPLQSPFEAGYGKPGDWARCSSGAWLSFALWRWQRVCCCRLSVIKSRSGGSSREWGSSSDLWSINTYSSSISSVHQSTLYLKQGSS